MDDRPDAEKTAKQQTPAIPANPPQGRRRNGIVRDARPVPDDKVYQTGKEPEEGQDHMVVKAAFVGVI